MGWAHAAPGGINASGTCPVGARCVPASVPASVGLSEEQGRGQAVVSYSVTGRSLAAGGQPSMDELAGATEGVRGHVGVEGSGLQGAV